MGDFTLLFSLTWGGVLAVLGTVFLTVSLFMKKRIRNKENSCSAKTIGKVVDIIESYETLENRGKGNRLYYPVLEYYVDGNPVTQRLGIGSNPCRYVVGQSVEMQYNPNKPGEIMLEGDSMLKKISKIFGIVAYILFALGILGIILVIVVAKRLA